MFSEKKTSLYYFLSLPLFALFIFCSRYFLESELLWLFLSCISVIIIARSVFLKKLVLPEKKFLWGFLILAVLLALNSVLNGSHLLELRWSERFIFASLVVAFMQPLYEDRKQFVSAIRLPFLFFLFICCFYSLYQYFTLYLHATTTFHNIYASFLRNINMYGQGMCLSLPLVFWLNSDADKNSRWRWFDNDFLLILMTATCLLSFARSSILAMGIFYLLEILRPTNQGRKKTIGLLLISIAFFASLNVLKNGFSTEVIQNKEKTVSYREALWQKSLLMLKEQPTGIGTGKFTFELFLYSDGPAQGDNLTDLFTSPHNEFLRFLAEEGLIFGSLYALFFIFIGLFSVKKIFFDSDTNLIYRFVLCLIPEMFFQFPTEVWYSSLLMALFAALSLTDKQNFSSLKGRSSRYLVFVFVLIPAIFYLFREVRPFASKYSPAYCSLYSDNWQVCVLYFRDHYIQKDYALADQTIRPILKRQPTNYIALVNDYSLGIEPRSQIEACLYYNLFNGKLSIYKDDKTICQLETDRKKLRETFDEFAQKR